VTIITNVLRHGNSSRLSGTSVIIAGDGEHSMKTLLQSLIRKMENLNYLVVDPENSSRNSIRRLLSEYAVKAANIVVVEKFDDAMQVLLAGDKKYNVLFISTGIGMSKFQDVIKTLHSQLTVKDTSCVVAVFSGTHVKFASAHTADEDIDAVILRPYTRDTLDEAFHKAIASKVNQTPYDKVMRLSRYMIQCGNIVEAKSMLEKCVGLVNNNVIALGYLGRIALNHEGDVPRATEYFRSALRKNSQHYHSLIGLFNCFMSTRQYPSAYKTLKVILTFHSIPLSIAIDAIKLVVMQEEYEDLDLIYEQIRDRQEFADVKFVLSAALVTYGLSQLKAGQQETAIAKFVRANDLSEWNTKIVTRVVKALASAGNSAEVYKILSRCSCEVKDSSEIQLALIQMKYRDDDPMKLLGGINELLKTSGKSEDAYVVAIKMAVKLQMRDFFVDELLYQAKLSYPEAKTRFQDAHDLAIRKRDAVKLAS
jgi:tetratricopeptide (TPR) repeat protein